MILIVEGLSVLLLFSYAGLIIGLASLLIGLSFLLILRGRGEPPVSFTGTFGVRMTNEILRFVGGEYVFTAIGAVVVVAVFVYNRWLSSNPQIGDSDVLTLLFGLTVMVYPVARIRYQIEASFALIFIGGVVTFLVLPQVLMAISGGGGGSSIGDWYVHYMLAAPFSGILDVIGISSSSVGNFVTIQFRDGSIHTLSISAYCAGMYSFSIFLSAFISFVLVFESLPRRNMAIVLCTGSLVAYLGNLLRMVAIGVIGYYRGIEALHWAHENAGWIIFLAWSSLFWWLILSYTSRRIDDEERGSIETK